MNIEELKKDGHFDKCKDIIESLHCTNVNLYLKQLFFCFFTYLEHLSNFGHLSTLNTTFTHTLAYTSKSYLPTLGVFRGAQSHMVLHIDYT